MLHYFEARDSSAQRSRPEKKKALLPNHSLIIALML